MEIRVVFRDIDYYRHVNNAVYITWMETARIDYCREAFDRPLGGTVNVIMASQRVDYEHQSFVVLRLALVVEPLRGHDHVDRPAQRPVERLAARHQVDGPDLR